jgi:UDP-N-acetylmuramoylalanine--D-glutamate ligase
VRVASREVRRAAVLGYGRTGRAVTEFFLSRGVTAFVSEAGLLSPSDQERLSLHGANYESGGHTTIALEEADLVVPSPGVPWSLPLLVEARRRGILTLSEVDLACLLLEPSCQVIAVTGTKGKGTTAELIAALLRRERREAHVAGNIGVPVVSILDRVRSGDVVVLEVSSFQLEQSRFIHPRVAVLTNLSPDHVDRHPTWETYVSAKAGVFRHLGEGDTAVLPSSLGELFPEIRGRRVFYDRIDLGRLPFLGQLPPHNQENLRAAIAACSALVMDFDPSTVRLAEIRGAFLLPFRLHEEGTLNGARVVNDAKSTNAASTVAALHSVVEPVVLILGGRHKQSGYDRLAHAIAERSVRRTVLYGEAAPFLERMLAGEGYTRILICENLEQAFQAALKETSPGDVLLFSPACSSFDQYTDAHARGEAFSQLVRSQPSFSPPPNGS